MSRKALLGPAWQHGALPSELDSAECEKHPPSLWAFQRQAVTTTS